MRLLAVLVVLVITGLLGVRAIHPSSPTPNINSAPAAQQVVNQARSDLQQAQDTNQAQIDQRLKGVEGQ
jgi:type II secretory pathway pseudopilin PulG